MAREGEGVPAGLPDAWRNAHVVVYQGPPPDAETPTRNALGLLFWLAMITLCLLIAGLCFMTIWGDKGLIRQIEAQERITADSDPLLDYVEDLRRQNNELAMINLDGGVTEPPALTDLPQAITGIKDLRERFDRHCLEIAGRVRGDIENRQQGIREALATNIGARERYDLLEQQRRLQEQLRSLQCAPARAAAECNWVEHDEDDRPAAECAAPPPAPGERRSCFLWFFCSGGEKARPPEQTS
jgi:hypothetical protein